MFNEHPENAGTPTDAPDDSENAGTPDSGDGSEAGEIKPVDGRLAMTWKAKAERVNELEDRLARMEAEREQRTTTDNRGSEADDARSTVEARRRELAEQQSDLAWMEELAKGGDRAAKAVLSAHKSAMRASAEALAAEERTVYRLEMSDIPSDRRDAVKAKIASTPGLKSPALALQLLNGSEHGTLAQENERLKRELEEAKKPRPKAEGRIPASSRALDTRTKDGMLELTVADYAKEMATPEGRAKINAARREGKLELKAR